jgi:hypothetical protein
MTATKQTELLPCPFCGGEPNLTHSDYVHDDLRPMPVVECKSCSAWVRAEDWNTRTQSAEPVQGEAVEYQQLSRYGNWDRIDKAAFDLGNLGQTPERFRALYTSPAKPDAELVELLAKLRRMVCATPENDIDRSGVWISTKHPVIARIDAKLAELKGDKN